MTVAPPSNRYAITFAVAALVFTAGCGAIGATSTTEEQATSTDNVDVGEFPEPPASLTAERAAETAAYHHLALLAERQELAQPSGDIAVPSLDSVTTDTVSREADGYYVSISLSSFVVEDYNVPELERAVYLVRENATPVPAYPIHTRPGGGSLESGSASGVDLQGANFAPNRTNLSVVVTSLDGSPSTEFVSTFELPAEEGVAVEDAIESPGRYRVTATTANASGSLTISVTQDSGDTPIGVFIGPDGSLEIYEGPG